MTDKSDEKHDLTIHCSVVHTDVIKLTADKGRGLYIVISNEEEGDSGEVYLNISEAKQLALWLVDNLVDTES